MCIGEIDHVNVIADACAVASGVVVAKNFKRITLLTDKMSAESQEFFKKQGFEYSNMIPMRRIID